MKDRAGSGQQRAPDGGLGVDAERRDSCVVLRTWGDIDYETADLFRSEVLAAAMQDSPPRVVLDLNKVTYCDSSGMGALVAIWKAVCAASGTVILAEVPEQAQRMLSYTGLDRRLTVRSTVPEAIADVSAATGRS